MLISHGMAGGQIDAFLERLFYVLYLFDAVGQGVSPAAFRRCDSMRENRMFVRLYSSQTAIFPARGSSKPLHYGVEMDF